MSDLPSVSGKDAVSAFENNGFVVVRITGSHHMMKKTDRPHLLTVPVHGNKTLKKGTLHGLIRAAGKTVEQFLEDLG